MQNYQSRASSSFVRHTANSPWVASVQEIFSPYGPVAASSLLEILLFMEPDRITQMDFDTAREFPSPYSPLKKLVTPAGFLAALRTLREHKLVGYDYGAPTISMDASLQTAIRKSMPKEKKQEAFSMAAFVWSNAFKLKPSANETVEQRRSTWTLQFRHVLFLLGTQDDEQILGSEYSATLAINAARLAHDLGRLTESKWLLQKARIDRVDEDAADVVSNIAEALLDLKFWSGSRLVRQGPAATPSEERSLSWFALEQQRAELEKVKPAMFATCEASLANVRAATREFQDPLRYAEVRSGIWLDRDPVMPENVVCKCICDGWWCTKLGQTDEAEQCFQRAIEVMKLLIDAMVQGRPLTLDKTPGCEDLYHFSERRGVQYHERRTLYDVADNGPRISLTPDIFIPLYRLTWYRAHLQFNLVGLLSDALENGSYMCDVARTQYHVARILQQLDRGAQSQDLRRMAISIGQSFEGQTWNPSGEADFEDLVARNRRVLSM